MEDESNAPHIFLASGPRHKGQPSFGSSSSIAKAVSKDRIDFTQLRIHYTDEIMRPLIDVKPQSRISEEEKGPLQPHADPKSCHDIPCLNKGKCINTSPPRCFCKEGFTGERCEKGN